MLEAKEICRAYGRRRVLQGASLKVEDGECVGIVGRNGCGKTTLLSILAGTQRAGGGSLLYNGQEALGHPEVFRRQAAYVPQENPLMEDLSVWDNLLLWHRGDRRALEEELRSGPAALLGMEAMRRQRVETLSGGMKKRLSIACALSGRAGHLIMDEPGAALDLECKQVIRDYLKQYLAEGGSVVLTSHEMEELAVCSRLYVLREGRLFPAEKAETAQELIAQF